MASDNSNPDRPGILRRVSRLITDQRTVRRLDGDPLRQDLLSSGHAVSYLRNLVRGNQIQRKRFGAETQPGMDRHPPVLLIHGFLGTRGSMYVIEERLIRDGYSVVSFNLGPLNVRDIRSSALLIHRKVQQLIKDSKHKRIDIVGHSMGGLIGLYYIKRLGGHEHVRRMVMLGTPARGTWAALAGIAMLGLLSTSAWQLLPGSEFLSELHQGPLPDSTEFFTIAAERDWFCPPESTQLEGAHAVTVPLGHGSLVLSEEVYRKVLWALRKDDAPR